MPFKILLSGGPSEGVVQTQVRSKDGRLWTVEIVHVNCVCDWCSPIGATRVEHIYERRDDDVFFYRESRSIPRRVPE